MRPGIKFLWVALASACLACGVQNASSRVVTRGQALDSTNGDGLNGDGLNGDGLNGDGLNGDGLNGSELGNHLVSVNYAGASLTGSPLSSTWITGSQLEGQRGDNGLVVTGTDLAGAQFSGTSDTGTTVNLRIASVTQDPAPDDDTWEYQVEYLDPSANAYYPLCVDGDGNPVTAFAVAGRWSYDFGTPGGGGKIDDPDAFTFACKGHGAIGKCVSPLGYKPWASYNGTSLDSYHQACVRMIRADFCGDGTSYTVDGNWIDLYDALGLQTDTENWVMEAEWDPNGARCMTSVSRSTRPVSCYAQLVSPTCGDLNDFQSGTLLMDEIPPNEAYPQ